MTDMTGQIRERTKVGWDGWGVRVWVDKEKGKERHVYNFCLEKMLALFCMTS